MNFLAHDPIKYAQINEYLLDSLENCESLGQFCNNSYQLLSNYIEFKKFYCLSRRNQRNLSN